jgi:hypothetical protein
VASVDRKVGSMLVTEVRTSISERTECSDRIADSFSRSDNSDSSVYATHIFSILLLTKNNLNGILLTYRKYSHLLVTDPNLTTAVDVKLIELIAKLTDYKKAHNEAIK